ACTRLLRWTLHELRAESGRTLADLLAAFQERYRSASFLESAKIERAAQPLAQELERPRLAPAGATTLASYCCNVWGEDAAAWREKVQRLVFAPWRGASVLAYAYISGAIPGLQAGKAVPRRMMARGGAGAVS